MQHNSLTFFVTSSGGATQSCVPAVVIHIILNTQICCAHMCERAASRKRGSLVSVYCRRLQLDGCAGQSLLKYSALLRMPWCSIQARRNQSSARFAKRGLAEAAARAADACGAIVAGRVEFMHMQLHTGRLRLAVPPRPPGDFRWGLIAFSCDRTGHAGVDQTSTLAVLYQHFHWPGIKSHVAADVECHAC